MHWPGLRGAASAGSAVGDSDSDLAERKLCFRAVDVPTQRNLSELFVFFHCLLQP